MRYSRDVPVGSSAEVILHTEEHIRAHLSSVATPDDDPNARAEDVRIELAVVGDQIRITGVLDAPPVAAYLRDDFDPYDGVPDDLRAEAP